MKKTEAQMAREGEFLREYGKQYFVVASEALSIGRVKWNMVPVGKGGQGDIAFYLTTEQMMALCAEILSGKFAEKIAADKGPYPKAYAYMTGEDGSLHLAIGGGNVGCRIQMRNLKIKPQLNYTMGVSMEAINTMARKYMLATGMTPVVPNTYYASVIAEFEAGRAERSKFRKPAPEELGDVVDSNSVSDETSEVTPNAPSANSAAGTATVEATQPKKVEDNQVNEKSGNSDDEEANYTLTVHGAKTLKKGFYCFDAVDANGDSVSLMFRKEDAEKLGWFVKFENAAATEDTKLTIRGEKRKNCILYKGPAKK